jgi:cytochrome c oxidase subunit 2
MAFDVVAMEAAAFDAWHAALSAPAVDVEGPGRALFDEYGCAACHVVRGHFAGAPIGPDLTHYGARASVAAGTLAMSLDATSRFIRDPREVKPGARMPSFRDMPREDADAIAAYLMELE